MALLVESFFGNILEWDERNARKIETKVHKKLEDAAVNGVPVGL